MITRDPYVVRWLDPRQGDTWMTVEAAAEVRPATVTTVGYLLVDDADLLVIAASTMDGFVGDVTAIPRACVLSQRKVKFG